RVLELPGDPGLVHEAGMNAAFVGAVRSQLLEGDLATQFIVASNPDLSDAALGVESQQGVTLPGMWFIGRSRFACLRCRRGRRRGFGFKLVEVGIVRAHDTSPSTHI